MNTDPAFYLRTPWARIVLANRHGRGMRLSPADVRALASDGAIVTRGAKDIAFAMGITDDSDDSGGIDAILLSEPK